MRPTGMGEVSATQEQLPGGCGQAYQDVVTAASLRKPEINDEPVVKLNSYIDNKSD